MSQRLELLFTVFVSASERIVFVCEPTNGHVADESHHKIKSLWQAKVLSHLCDGDGWSEGSERWEDRQSLIAKRLTLR